MNTAWEWVTRGLAVIALVDLMLTAGLDKGPWGLYVLLLGLFFGPEVIKGQIRINKGDDK